MSLSKDRAESEFGLAFYMIEERFGDAPDQALVAADMTIDGHTAHFEGKSEDEILAQAERLLMSRGRLSGGKG